MTKSSTKPSPNIASPTGTQRKRPDVDVSESSAVIGVIATSEHSGRGNIRAFKLKSIKAYPWVSTTGMGDPTRLQPTARGDGRFQWQAVALRADMESDLEDFMNQPKR